MINDNDWAMYTNSSMPILWTQLHRMYIYREKNNVEFATEISVLKSPKPNKLFKNACLNVWISQTTYYLLYLCEPKAIVKSTGPIPPNPPKKTCTTTNTRKVEKTNSFLAKSQIFQRFKEETNCRTYLKA